MTRRRSLPPALGERALPLLVLAGALVVAGVFGVLATVSGARDAKAFERRALLASATVEADPSSDGFHVLVRYVAGGEARVGRAPVVDAEPYEPGEQVAVRYDPRQPDRVQLVEQPYDLATPLAFGVGLAVLGVVLAAATVWWPWRLLRLARSDRTAYAFAGRLASQRRRLLGERPWVLLDALDARPGSAPVAAVPLLRNQRLPSDASFDARVKGTVRDGAAAVVLIGDQVLWPAGRVRVGPVSGLATGDGA